MSSSSKSSMFSGLSNSLSAIGSSVGSISKEVAVSMGTKTKEMAASVTTKAREMVSKVQQTYGSNGGGEEPSAAAPKRAVLIGTTYASTHPSLGLKTCSGSINSAEAMKRMLVKSFAFPESQIVFLRDDGGDSRPEFAPTRENIIKACQWLVSDLSAGTSLFFFFSGHGGQQRSLTGDESDGFNEVIFPCDGVPIIDDELNRILVNPLPPSVILHSLIDACHSGSALDLQHQTFYDYSRGCYTWKCVALLARRPDLLARKGTRGGLAVHFAACADHELSYQGEARNMFGIRKFACHGLATNAFIQSIEKNRLGSKYLGLSPAQLSYGSLLSHMNDLLVKSEGSSPFQGGGGAQGPKSGLGLGVAASMVGSMIAGPIGGMLGSGAASAASMDDSPSQHPVFSCNQPLDLNLPLMIGGIP